MAEYYDIRQEGHKEAWDYTAGAAPEDWDKALAVAQERATSQGRNYVVRHVSRGGARLIVTATPEGELAWPRLATPLVDLQTGQLADREPELRRPPKRSSGRPASRAGPWTSTRHGMLGLSRDERTIAVALNASGCITAAATGDGFVRGGRKLDQIISFIKDANP